MLFTKFKLIDVAPKGDWYVSRKFDGVRCAVDICTNRLITRNNIVFENETFVRSLNISQNVVLDCEFVAANLSQMITKFRKLQKKQFVTDFLVLVIEAVPREEFFGNVRKTLFLQRQLSNLQVWTNQKHGVYRIAQHKVTNPKLESPKHWEGIVLRKNTLYGTAGLKWKRFCTDEFQIVAVTIINKRLKNIVVKKGNIQSKVGTGFTNLQRATLRNLVGKYATIKYFEETKTSLRHPSFVSIRDYE